MSAGTIDKTFTYGEMRSALKALQSLAERPTPPTTTLRIAQNINALKRAKEDYDDAIEQMHERRYIRDDDGNPKTEEVVVGAKQNGDDITRTRYQIDDRAKLESEVSDLLGREMEGEVTLKTLSLKKLSGGDDEKMAAKDISDILFLIENDLS